MYNRVVFLGNLTRDPEIRYLPNGTAVCDFCLASNRRWKSESGEQKEEAVFVDFTTFGPRAEAIGQYRKKGQQLLVEGYLKLDQWDDKETGQKRSRLKVMVDRASFIGGERKEEQNGGRQDQLPPSRRDTRAANERVRAAVRDSADDVPF